MCVCVCVPVQPEPEPEPEPLTEAQLAQARRDSLRQKRAEAEKYRVSSSSDEEGGDISLRAKKAHAQATKIRAQRRMADESRIATSAAAHGSVLLSDDSECFRQLHS